MNVQNNASNVNGKSKVCLVRLNSQCFDSLVDLAHLRQWCPSVL
jgi:hypothetical protein